MNNAKRKKDPDHLHPGHPPRRSERKVPRPVGLRPLRVAPEEARARAWAIRAIGLETGPDGLQRLVLRRK